MKPRNQLQPSHRRRIDHRGPRSDSDTAEVLTPGDPDLLPQSGVSDFIERLARANHIAHRRTGLDDWAEAVTRLAGDEVKLDATGKLLVELKKRQLIDDRQMSRLMTNLIRERRRV